MSAAAARMAARTSDRGRSAAPDGWRNSGSELFVGKGGQSSMFRSNQHGRTAMLVGNRNDRKTATNDTNGHESGRALAPIRVIRGRALRGGLAVRLAALCAVAALTAGTALAQDPTTRPGQTQPAPGVGPAEADLPVRAVTLYSSGVGYFEHAGAVDGDASAVLRFKT